MIVFDFTVKKHPEATPPDFSKQYKKEETIKRKEQEWEDEGGWMDSPASCIVGRVLMADPDNLEKDVELPMTENTAIQFVKDITDPDQVIVADDITQKTCILANTINHLITQLETDEDPKEDDQAVIDELKAALANLYDFKLSYIHANFVYGNCHNLAKTLKWDGLDGKVPQKMLGLSEKATRLSVLHTLALRCGLK